MKDERDFEDDIIKGFTNYKNARDFYADYKKNEQKPFAISGLKNPTMKNESASYTGSHALNEYDDGSLDMKEETLKIESPEVNYDQIYIDMYNYLSSEMQKSIGDRANWVCFKDLREKMKKLKEAADKEIKKRIELVCKTGGQKSLVKWPMKAEGLLGMWERYSSELDLRIDNRVNQLTGLGGAETGSANMLEDFLTSTYPQIIAMMLTYKCVFEQIADGYKNNYVPQYTLEDQNEIQKEFKQEYTNRIKLLILSYASRNKSV